MKKNIFLYLFVFTALIALYFGVSGNRLTKKHTDTIVKQKEQLTLLEDSIQALHIKFLDTQYFSLQNNDDALAYYDHLNLEYPSRYIEDKLLETNESKGDNPLVPYAGMEGNFKINKIKVLNHKWILADFSDGQYWGDLILKYELKDDLSTEFTLLHHLLYAKGK